MRYVERGFALQYADAPAIVRKADLRFAATVEVQCGPVVQRDVAHLANGRLISVDTVEGANRNDGGHNEEQYGNARRDHDIARQASLFFFADNGFKRGQADVGCRTFQPLCGLPSGFGARESDRMFRVGFDPCTKIGFVLR